VIIIESKTLSILPTGRRKYDLPEKCPQLRALLIGKNPEKRFKREGRKYKFLIIKSELC